MGLWGQGRWPDVLIESASLASGSGQVPWKKSQAGSTVPLIWTELMNWPTSRGEWPEKRGIWKPEVTGILGREGNICRGEMMWQLHLNIGRAAVTERSLESICLNISFGRDLRNPIKHSSFYRKNKKRPRRWHLLIVTGLAGSWQSWVHCTGLSAIPRHVHHSDCELWGWVRRGRRVAASSVGWSSSCMFREFLNHTEGQPQPSH